MNNNTLVIAVSLGVIAASALVLSLLPQVNADTLVGYGSVLALVAVAAVEYRINWKRVFSR